MLKKVLFKEDKHLYVDWDYLKDSFENGRLQGATVFARLFDIIDDKLFVLRNTDEYDLTHYDIYIEDWCLFMSFIRNGYIPNSCNFDKKVRHLNYCYDICIKFGGVPEFDNYYNNSFNYEQLVTDVSNNVYNPMTPIEDIRGMYIWSIVTPLTELKINESVTNSVSAESATAFYCRRPINF
tara:strand:- start:4199 stop:4741 length:543 start_codon:yes stop_codon:yes gene_type:complete